MSDIVKIDDEVFTSEDFIKLLKLNGRFEGLMEDILKEKLTVRAAKKLGISVSADEIQERSDQFRRVHGLHRAKDTNNYLDALGITLDDFETFITDMMYQEKMIAEVYKEAAVDEYFRLNSPRFDSIEVSHIVVDSQGKAKEMISVLTDDPESFEELAREHSVADTRESGGRIGKVLRGSLQNEVEAKVFNAQAGELLGPFPSGDGSHYEIFRVDEKNPARLDDETTAEIRRLLREEWLAARAREHRIEVL